MDTQVCIIGAGVVGLAIARQLSNIFDQVIILEKNESFGQETSSRNSEVIHSGLYYPKNSLKAKLCLRGNNLIYDYAREKEIAHSNCGKLIVANTPEDLVQLENLKLKARQNKVKGVRLLDTEEILQKEENIKALKALYVPSTGIIDSHGLMQNLLNDALQKKAEIVYKSEVIALGSIENGYRISVKENELDNFDFSSSIVINCAGLNSSKISSLIPIENENYKLHPCKGEYFRVKAPKNKLVNGLVYPVPFSRLQGLGVHVTKELDGGLKLGPNIIYTQNDTDYSVNPDHLHDFYSSAKKFLPFLEKSDLMPEMAGIRPKLQGPKEGFRDFIIHNEADRGYPNFINLLGIESPGLTASMAIAQYVENIILN